MKLSKQKWRKYLEEVYVLWYTYVCVNVSDHKFNIEKMIWQDFIYTHRAKCDGYCNTGLKVQS